MSTLRKSLITLAVFGLSYVDAQTTQASCGTQYSWMFNSLGQSPCLVAAILGNTCVPKYNVAALPGPDSHYTPGSPINLCDCTTVEYSLYSACAACQSATVSPWADWSTNCSAAGFGSVADGQFPTSLGIPNGTAVPAWAFQKILSSNPAKFDVSEAQRTGDEPEGLPSKPGSPASSSVPGGATSTASPSPSAPSKSNVGAIAGGVVGGVFGLAIIVALLIWFCFVRPRKQQNAQQHVSLMKMNEDASTVATSSVYNPPLSSKPYNPDDPSTFPPTPMSFSHSHKPSTSVGSTANDESMRYTHYDPNQSIDV